MSLTISTTDGPSPTLALSGRLDTHTAPDLDQALNRLFTPGRNILRLVFDLSRLEYLSSAGIRCFVRARKAVEPTGGKVALVNPQPGVRKVLDIVRAVPPSRIFASTAELDAYLDDMQRQVGEHGHAD
ncbi:MAG TPA: STAS domain-containing protein [Vicinamibacterales bacterium]|nr:STAS domain-containing protein [Vicinamibacterales bacterium]